MTTFKKIVTHSVFRRLKPGMPMDHILAMLFHRAAATMYFIYMLWALFALTFGIVPITEGVGAIIGRIIFPVIVLISSSLAAFGATFWPNMARLELFAGSAFGMGLMVYLYFVFMRILEGEGSWAGFIILLSILVVPVARTAIIIIFLLRQAHPERELKLLGD